MKLKTWIEAARLRTLPLSLSGILVGSFIAFKQGYWSTTIFILSLLTTLFFQILSNFANDLGDSLKGTDNEHRVGPMRAVQSGKISKKEMIAGTVVMSLLSLSTAIPLVFIGTKEMTLSALWIYIFLAFLSVAAAITYTIGKRAYGYNGMGDVMVFIFFGLVSVIGVYCLYTKALDWSILLFAIGIGSLSIAVLNLNNMRDHENDRLSGKRTLVIRMGFEKAKIYQTTLIVLSFISIFIFITIQQWWWSMISLLPFFILTKHVKKVWKTVRPHELDSELKVVSLSTFSIAVLFLISTLL